MVRQRRRYQLVRARAGLSAGCRHRLSDHPDVAFVADPSPGCRSTTPTMTRATDPGNRSAAPAWQPQRGRLIAIAIRTGRHGRNDSRRCQSNPARALRAPTADFRRSSGAFHARWATSGVTGLGTPKADALVPDLASTVWPTSSSSPRAATGVGQRRRSLWTTVESRARSVHCSPARPVASRSAMANSPGRGSLERYAHREHQSGSPPSRA